MMCGVVRWWGGVPGSGRGPVPGSRTRFPAAPFPYPLAGLTLAVAVSCCAATGAAPPNAGLRPLSPAEAQALLERPVQIDPKAATVMARVTASYRRMQALESLARTGRSVSVARLKRPRLYHFLQSKPDGELIALAVSDGTRYYEYTERTRQYLEREAAILDALTLPVNVRFFFAAQRPGGIMRGLDGKPSVREYAYRYQGREKVSGHAADVLTVSTLTRGPEGWRAFEGTRAFDARTGLLLRSVNGGNRVLFENHVNPKLPTESFRWKPIPGATKGFG